MEMLTIPNKADYIQEREKLNEIHTTLGTQIGKLKEEREELIRRESDDITLDNAVDMFTQFRENVNIFNTSCNTAQDSINANNDALRNLLDRIKIVKQTTEAEKAAADAATAAAAAAAQTAAEKKKAAALQQSKDALNVYIASLQEILRSIENNTLDETVSELDKTKNIVNEYIEGLNTAVASANEKAITPTTRDAIEIFKRNTTEFMNLNLPSFNTSQAAFNTKKSQILRSLNDEIKALQDVDGDPNVTAENITDELKTAQQKKVDSNELNQIKDGASKVVAEFGTRATTDFAAQKQEIERMIQADNASFQEKQKIIEEHREIMDILDSPYFKASEAAIQENITKAIDAEKVALVETSNITQKMLKNTQFGTAITNLNTSISSLKRELAEKLKPLNILNLDAKLQELKTKSAKIQPPPIDLAPIQAHINTLKAANAEYERLHKVQTDRADELSAEKLKPRPPETQRPTGLPRNVPTEKPSLGPEESSLPEPKRKPGRRYSIFIPTPIQKKPPTSRAEAAAASNPDNTEDVIDPTVLEIFVYEDEKESEASVSTGAGAGAGAGGGFIQRGGEPPKVAKIIKVKQITPEIQNLFLSFKTPSEILTPEFLDSIEKNQDSTTEVVDTPKDIDTEMAEMAKKKDEFIQNDDTSDFLSKLGEKVSHKTTIDKLMIFLDTSKNEENKPIRHTQNGKTYQDMYVRLWQFMEYTSGSIAILRSVFNIKDTKMEASLLAATASGISQRRKDLTWIGPQENSLFNTLFMEFSKCYNKDGNDDGTYSLFLKDQVSRKGAQKYRFMLNWIILIAFHWYYTQKEKSQQDGLIDCGEFIEHLYHTFIGWMEKMDSQTLNNVFKPVSQDAIDYKERVKLLIGSDFKTDSTLKSLINWIREYLCSYTNKGKREIANPKKTKGPAPAKSQALSGSQRLPPPTEPPPPSIASESDSDSDSDPEPLKSGSAKLDPLFTRTGRTVVPPLKVKDLPSQSGSLTDRPTGFRSNFNLKESIEYGKRNSSVGKGAMGPLPPIITDRPQFKRSSSGSVIQTQSPPPTQTVNPTPPTTEKPSDPGLSATQRRRLSERFKGSPKGGHKRTRKHRSDASVASSAPAPPTRRHRDRSSSAHKHTRRRRRAH